MWRKWQTWRRWQKGLLLGLGLCVLAIAMLQTQPVESLLLREIAKRMPPGYTLKAKRLDINLFALSATLQDLSLEGGPDVILEEVYVNAGSGVLRGMIDLESVRVARGHVLVKPSEKPEEPSAPFKLPLIKLGRAEISDVVVQYKDQATALNLGFDDLNLAYADNLLTAALKTSELNLDGRLIPALQLNLSTRSEHFNRFDDVLLTLNSEFSRVVVKGSFDLEAGPNLSMESQLCADLVPELDGLSLQAKLDPDWLEASFETVYPLETPVVLEASTRFEYRLDERRIPIELRAGDLLKGRIDLSQGAAGIKGTYHIKGDPTALAALDKSLAGLAGLTLKGDFNLDAEGGPKASAHLEVIGTPKLALDLLWENQRGLIQGEGSLIEGNTVRFSGDATPEKVQVSLLAGLDQLKNLAPFVTLPEELDAGNVNLDATLVSDYKSWKITQGHVLLNQVSYMPWLETQDLLATVSGDGYQLVGSITAPRLNNASPIATFNLNVLDQIWNQLDVSLIAPNMYLDDTFRYDAHLEASGSGPLVSPQLEGSLSAIVHSDQPVAHLEAPFQFKSNKLDLSDFFMESAHGVLKGNASLKLAEPLRWDLDLDLDLEQQAGFKALIEAELPMARLELKGNQENLVGRLVLPGQDLNYEKIAVPLSPNLDVTLNIQLPGQLSGQAPEWDVAGLGFSQFGFTLRKGVFQASTHFRVTQPEALERALGEYWPEEFSLQKAEGDLSIRADLKEGEPVVSLKLNRIDALYCQAPVWVENVEADYAKTLTVKPFKAHFAGVDAAFDTVKPQQIAQRLKSLPQPNKGLTEDDALALSARFELVDAAMLGRTIDLPPDLTLDRFSGIVKFFADAEFEKPRLHFSELKGEATYETNQIRLENMAGTFGQGLWLRSGTLFLNDLELAVTPSSSGFALTFEPTVDDIDQLIHGFAGNAKFEVSVDVHNEPENQFSMELVAAQTSGSLVHLNPWLIFTNFQATATYTAEEGLILRDTGGNLNGGTVTLSGSAVPRDSEFELTFGAVADNVILDLIDMRMDVSTALEWHSDATENKIRATAYVNHGYYAPKEKVKELIGGLLKAVDELYFPDPMLEKVELEGFVSTKSPFIVETDLAYLEIETPWLIIGGNLAKPQPIEGYVNINKGSSLDMKNQSLVFQDSQIQFLKNRPDDPYLLVSLVFADDAQKNAINLTGFTSELGQKEDTQNLSALLANYLLGQTAMVSLEEDHTNSVYDDSLNFVVSKRLSRKVVTRYSVPITKTGQQRAVLSVGPFRSNFFNITSQRSDLGGEIQHSRKFGYPDGKRPAKIHKIVWNDDVPKWVRRAFKLRREQVYSETLWRRASLSLTRRLNEDGYLEPKLTHEWVDNILTVGLEFGSRTSLEIRGLVLSEDDRKALFRAIPSLDVNGLRALESRIERLAISQGHPSAAAMARLEGNQITVNTFLSQPIRDTNLDFGKANGLLSSMYKSREARSDLIGEYLLSADDARSRIRARLAALGYVDPELGKGEFVDLSHFSLPIEPGPRALLIAVTEDGNPLASTFLNKPFNYAVIEKVVDEFEVKEGDTVTVSVTPRRMGENVVLEVKRRVIEDLIIDTISITGTDRIGESKIRTYLGLHDGMTQQALIEAQQDLLMSGPFVSARLQAGNEATLEVQERNRFDADYLVSWDEEDGLGHALQFKDFQLFHGFNSLALKGTQTTLASEFYGRLKFDRVWGSKLDITASYNWIQPKRSKDSQVVYGSVFDFFDKQTTTNLIRVHKPILEFGYPLTKNQQLTLGGSYERLHTTTRVESEIGDEVEVTNSYSFGEVVPVSLSWVYRKLDLPVGPKNGLLIALTTEYFTNQGGSTTYTGPRYKAGFSTFKSWGPLTWSNRVDSGIFEYEEASNFVPNARTTPYFLLGGSTTVRGYRQDFVGPLKIIAETDDTSFGVDPFGGRAMFFTSQELTYTTPYFGLGLTPFVDSGWVWSDYKDLFQSRLLVSGGLGLSLESPVGYFRVDWAKPIDDKALDASLSVYDSGEIDRIKDQMETQFYLRFGRVF